MKRYHLIFKGRVQGVGFRYKARRWANDLNLTGNVKNLYDGTVEMEIQGDQETIDSLLYLLKNDRFIRIEEIEKEEIDLLAEDGFIMLN